MTESRRRVGSIIPFDPATLRGSHLPAIHHFAHSYSLFLYGTMLEYLRYGYHDIFSTVEVKFESEAERDVAYGTEDGPPLAAWLRERRPHQFDELAARYAFANLLGDALHFIYEGLKCSEKGKLNVAFALIRKPLRESLLFLELLLSDQARFLRTASVADTRARNVEHFSQAERGRAIVAAAIKKLSGMKFDPKFVYDLRYNKRATYSLERWWNPATHLITDHHEYATAPEDFNFLFFGNNEWAVQWDEFYNAVPFLLFYMTELVVAQMRRFTDGDFAEPWDMQLRRVHGFILWRHYRAQAEAIIGRGGGTSAIEDYTLICPYCGGTLLGDARQVWRLYANLGIECASCRLALSVTADQIVAAPEVLRRMKRRRVTSQIVRTLRGARRRREKTMNGIS